MPHARKDEIQWLPGQYYHIYNRGARRGTIFPNERNYDFALQRMQQYGQENAISVIAYCLMPNHYHWLVRQDGDKPAGTLAQRVFNSYTKAYNNAYCATGTLFEARFKAKHIDSDEYFRHLCRYIHANPVKDGLADALDLWPFSNYAEWMGTRKGALVDLPLVAEMFPARRRYKAFVEDYLRTRWLPEGLAKYLLSLEQE